MYILRDDFLWGMCMSRNFPRQMGCIKSNFGKERFLDYIPILCQRCHMVFRKCLYKKEDYQKFTFLPYK